VRQWGYRGVSHRAGGGETHAHNVGEQPRGMRCVWSSPHLAPTAPQNTDVRAHSCLCCRMCAAGHCATFCERWSDGATDGMAGMATAAVGGETCEVGAGGDEC
jgi:hypothetical protein